jgi:hypothetical protein
VYVLLRRSYQLLDDGMAPDRVARWYEFGLADALGMRPEVERCVECDRLLEPSENYRWVPALGGVLCDDHLTPPAEQAPLSTRRAQAAARLPAHGHRGRSPASACSGVERGTPKTRCAAPRSCATCSSASRRSLCFLDECPHGAPPVAF